MGEGRPGQRNDQAPEGEGFSVMFLSACPSKCIETHLPTHK